MNGQLPAKKALDFILAGKATVTLVSKATGTRFTYRVNRPNDTSPHFVRLLTGADNRNSYSYMGRIADGTRYIHDKRNQAGNVASASAKGFKWVLYKLIAREFDFVDDKVEIWHSGKCGRCGRTLTVPESIESGIGPVCAGKAQPAARSHNVVKNAKPIQEKAAECKATGFVEGANDAKLVSVESPSGATYTVEVLDGAAYCGCEWGSYRPVADQRTGCSHSIAALDYIEKKAAGRKLSVWVNQDDANRQHRPSRNIGDGIVVTSRLLEAEAELDLEFARQEIAQDQAAEVAKMRIETADFRN